MFKRIQKYRQVRKARRMVRELKQIRDTGTVQYEEVLCAFSQYTKKELENIEVVLYRKLEETEHFIEYKDIAVLFISILSLMLSILNMLGNVIESPLKSLSGGTLIALGALLGYLVIYFYGTGRAKKIVYLLKALQMYKSENSTFSSKGMSRSKMCRSYMRNKK